MKKKWYTKINRGAILTALVILGVIVYLLSLKMIHNAAKPEIEAVCRDYYAGFMKYTQIPDDILLLSDEKQFEELDKHIDKMKKELAEFYPEGNQYQSLTSDLEMFLKNQIYSQEFVESVDHSIVRFLSYIFEDDMVTVNIQAKYSQKGMPASEVEDQIMLIKNKDKDGWDIVYASISLPDALGDGTFPDFGRTEYR